MNFGKTAVIFNRAPDFSSGGGVGRNWSAYCNTAVFGNLPGNETDALNLDTLTLAANASVDIDVGATLTLNADQSIATTGTGSIDLTTPRNIVLSSGSALTTVDGGITLLANDGGATAGDFDGISASSATIGTRTKMGNMAVENCLAGCHGERPPNLVNPEIYG